MWQSTITRHLKIRYHMNNLSFMMLKWKLFDILDLFNFVQIYPFHFNIKKNQKNKTNYSVSSQIIVWFHTSRWNILSSVISFEIFKFPWRPLRAYSSSKSSETVFCVPRGLLSLKRGTIRRIFREGNPKLYKEGAKRTPI